MTSNQPTPDGKPPGSVLYQLEPGTGVLDLVISNVARYNAMSLRMWQSLFSFVQQADQDPAVRVIVLRGDGDKAFVSGADISEFGHLRNSPEQVQIYGRAVHDAQQALIRCSKPVIAAIQGVCMGGGIGLALSCDLRYASVSSRFRMPAARMGLGYDRTGMARAVSVLGPARATDIFFTARTFNGAQAADIGMVHEAFADDEFHAEAKALIQAVAGNAPLTLKAAKLAIRAAMNDPQIDDPAVVDAAVQACFDSSDYQEGQRAFKEKRNPEFTGR
jgi:enoyl-CoA hydratase/carnithine racemase